MSIWQNRCWPQQKSSRILVYSPHHCGVLVFFGCIPPPSATATFGLRAPPRLISQLLISHTIHLTHLLHLTPNSSDTTAAGCCVPHRASWRSCVADCRRRGCGWLLCGLQGAAARSHTTHHTALISCHSSDTTNHTPLILQHSSHSTHLTAFISHNSSFTSHFTQLISHQSSHTIHLTPLISQHSNIHYSSYTTQLITNA